MHTITFYNEHPRYNKHTCGLLNCDRAFNNVLKINWQMIYLLVPTSFFLSPDQASSKIVSSITSKKYSNSTEKNNDNFNIEPREPVFDRTTRKQMEKERRKTVREQTVLNKPLKQWILVDSSSISSPRSDYLEPRLRLESLRAMSKKPASLNWWDKSNNMEDMDVPFSNSFPKGMY